MSKFIIFILIFNTFCFVQNFDIYNVSDHKNVDKVDLRRQIHGQQPKPSEIKISYPDDPKEQNDASNNDKILENKDKSLPAGDSGKTNSNSKPDSAIKASLSSDKVKEQAHEDNNQVHVQSTLVKINTNVTHDNNETKTNATEKGNESSVTTFNHKGKIHNKEHPGALLRGFYVFLGLSLIVVFYFGFKAFRLRPGAPPSTTVRKYGVVGRRSDMEMLPLPLAEEEDDDTLFDVGNTQMNR